MGLQSLCGRVLLGLSLSLLLSSFCIADDKTIKVVGFGECADCKENNINTIHALSGSFLLIHLNACHVNCLTIIMVI